MENPGIYHPPTEMWPFVPAVGVLVALGLIALSILLWMGDRDLRRAAAVGTVVALAVSVLSVLGLLLASSSFAENDARERAAYVATLQAWAEDRYSIVLDDEEAAVLGAGGRQTVSVDGRSTSVRLAPLPNGDAYLVDSNGNPVQP